MKILRKIHVISLLLIPLTAAGEPAVKEQVHDFAIDRYHDARRLLEGTREPAPVVVQDDLSCVELYERRMALLRHLNDYKPAYWEDRRNQAAVLLGTVWTPAYYFLGYSAVSAHLAELNDIDPQMELDALRYASARKRCFQK